MVKSENNISKSEWCSQSCTERWFHSLRKALQKHESTSGSLYSDRTKSKQNQQNRGSHRKLERDLKNISPKMKLITKSSCWFFGEQWGTWTARDSNTAEVGKDKREDGSWQRRAAWFLSNSNLQLDWCSRDPNWPSGVASVMRPALGCSWPFSLFCLVSEAAAAQVPDGNLPRLHLWLYFQSPSASVFSKDFKHHLHGTVLLCFLML